MKNRWLAIRIFAIFAILNVHFNELMPNSKAQNIQSNNDSICQVLTMIEGSPLQGEVGRILVLVSGFTSKEDHKESHEKTWHEFLVKVKHLFGGVIFFSYNEEDLYKYDESHTARSLNSSVSLLNKRLNACINSPSNNINSFTLVGHSVGGVIITKYMQQHGFDLNDHAAQKVTHILALASPINGLWFAHCTNIRTWLFDKCTLDVISSFITVGVGAVSATEKMRDWLFTKLKPQLKGTDAAYELGWMYEDRTNLNDNTLQNINRLKQRNSADGFSESYPVSFRFLYNNLDAVLMDSPTDNKAKFIQGYTFRFNHFPCSVDDPSCHDVVRREPVLRGEIGQKIVEFLTSSLPSTEIDNTLNALEPRIIAQENAIFTDIESPADSTVVAPNQPIHKTWRVKNTGNRIWGPDHKLVFIGGNQMGAPNAVNIPVTEPGGVADLSIDVTAPDISGTHRGEWRLRNPQGTFFGDKLWVQIVVPETNNSQPTGMGLTCTNCPSTVTPGQSFRPTVRVSGSVPLLQSRGDMLRNTDGNRYGAWEFVAVNGAVNQGQSYDFTFYEQNPTTAPNNEGVYESKWRVWQNGGWVGPELTIRFEVKAGGGGSNHAPNPPTLTGPGDWAVYTGNGGINLQAQQNGDPNGDAITHYYFEIFESAQTPNSGWITSNSWAPAGLGNYGFQWRVKVRDARGAESGWSEVRHFNINDPTPQIQSFTWTWCHEPWGPADKVCFCAKTTGGGLELKLNSANDGSDRGAWKVIGHGDTNLNCDNDNDRPPNWGQLEAEAGSYRVRLYARPKGEGGWPAAATADVVVSLPPNQRPGSPSGIAPAYDEYVNTKTVKLDWQQTYRTTNYRLQISLDPNFGTALVDTHLPADVSEYTYTFADEYATVYWQVLATGPYGTHDSGRRQFHLDLSPPSSSIPVLPAVTTDTKFNVNWGGSDARAGLRWYHVQVRDGNRADSQWSDWLVNTTKTAELFVGQAGHTYYFRVRAMDNLGIWEEWPAGDGDTYTLVDPSAIPPTTWWHSAYGQKRNLIILNNDGDSIPAQYPIRLHFDNTTSPTAAEIYAASVSANKGDDVRIVYNNQTEVARYLLHFTPTAIDLWFPYQIGLGGGQTDSGSHQLYYSNTQASNPPADANTVFQPKADGNTMGLWHFQEGNGSSVADASGRNHHGNFINSGWSDGYWGRAGSFNGTNAYVEIGHSDDFKPGAITLEALIYWTNRTGEFPMLFNKDRYWMRLTSSGELQFLIKADGGDRTITGQTHLALNQWYHVAATYDGGQVMRLFVNGKLDREQTNGAPPSAWNSQPLRIGRSDYNSASYFPGYIQHAHVSNVARTDFSYGAIDSAPSVAAGSSIAPPVSGAADLTVLGLNTYPNSEGGIIVEALVQNQGSRETQNGFYTDLYIDHLPTGAGDYTGSARFWVNSPIAAGATVTLTTVLTNFNGGAVMAAQSQVPAAEVTHLLYMQTDSAGVVPDADKTNNILSTGVEVCLANPDAFEGDDSVAQAAALTLNQTQSHNFSDAGDQDWVKFNAETGQAYTFSTRNLGPAADTYLYLYSTDGATLLTANDDGNDSLASQIQWTAPAATTYYLLVRHWNPNVAGCGSGYELLVESGQTAPTPTFTPTPTATPDTSQPVTPTPTATATKGNQPAATRALYLPNIHRDSKSGSTIGVTVTPSPVTAQPAAVLLSNALVETCKWAIQMGLTGFTPNSPITVASAYSEVTCPQGQQNTASWSQVYPTTTDRQGALVVAYLHQGTGSYTYTFTDPTGKSATLSFNTKTADVTETPVPTPLPSATPTFTPSPTPTYSQLLAYAVNQNENVDIYQMRSDGSAPKNLTNHPAFEWGPSWSPDGEQIAFVSNRDGNFEIYVMNADGSAQRRLTQNTLYDIGPVWSLDGQWIAYKSFENGDYRIYLLKADGSAQQLLTTGANSDWRMSWSPDGTRLAFSSFRNGNGEIYLINADGTGSTRITNEPTEDNDAAWSPDGGKLAFVSRRDGNQEIYVVNLDGSNPVRLTNNPAADSIPIWSPDGSKLAFTSNRDGFDAVYLMNADGSAQTRITNGPHGSNFAVWRPR